MSDVERMVSAADRIESAAHRMALLFEDGYGGAGVRLLEAVETDVAALRAKLQAAEALNEEYRIQLLMADKISGDQRSRAEAAEATIKSLVDLTKYGEEMQELLSDPLMVASWIKEGIEGAHSLRDETLAENQRLQAEVARLKDGIRKIKSKVNPMVDAPIWHMANAMISEWKP